MASSSAFLDAVKGRRSMYRINSESPISDAQIEEIVKFAVTNSPSPFNVQSCRCIVLFGDHHKKLWQKNAAHMKAVMTAEAFAGFVKKLQGLEAGHGTILFFEDQIALEGLKQKNAMLAPLIPEWSAQSSGMNQFVVWTALTAEGLGCNLQHYNFLEAVNKDVQETWNVSEHWKLNAQLVFGKPFDSALPKTFHSIEDRVRVVA